MSFISGPLLTMCPFIAWLNISSGCKPRGFIVSSVMVQTRKPKLWEGKWLVQDQRCVIFRVKISVLISWLLNQAFVLNLLLIFLLFNVGRYHLPLCFFKIKRYSPALFPYKFSQKGSHINEVDKVRTFYPQPPFKVFLTLHSNFQIPITQEYSFAPG